MPVLLVVVLLAVVSSYSMSAFMWMEGTIAKSKEVKTGYDSADTKGICEVANTERISH